MDCRAIRTGFFIIALFLALSCDKKAESAFQASLLPGTEDCTADQSDLAFTVVSPQPWKLVCSESWCKAIPTDGSPTSSRGTAVNIHLEDNPGFERTCEVSLIIGEKTVATSVVNQGHSATGLIIEQTQYSLSGQRQRLEVACRSGESLVVDPQVPWISVVQVERDRIVLEIESYEPLIKRTGQVRVIASGGQERVLEITQGDGFTDPQMYENLLIMYDADGDGFLSRSEASGVEVMNINTFFGFYQTIQTLDGFDYFPNLKELKIKAEDYFYHSNPCRRKLYVDGHPKLTTLEIDGYPAYLALISASNCPNLESVVIENGYNLDEVDVSHCPKLHTLHLVNGTTGHESDELSHLMMEGSPRVSTLILGLSRFLEEPDFGSLEELRTVDFYNVLGLRCLDLTKSRYLESVSWWGWRIQQDNKSYLLLPQSREGAVQVDCHPSVSVLYL
jgi:hypothetical protein